MFTKVSHINNKKYLNKQNFPVLTPWGNTGTREITRVFWPERQNLATWFWNELMKSWQEKKQISTSQLQNKKHTTEV